MLKSQKVYAKVRSQLFTWVVILAPAVVIATGCHGPSLNGSPGDGSLQLQITSLGGASAASGSCNLFKVTSVDQSLAPVVVSSDTLVKLSSSGTGTFYSDNSCASGSNGLVTIAANTSSAQFAYKNIGAGTDTISGTSDGIAGAELSFTSSPNLVVTTNPAASASACLPFGTQPVLTAQDSTGATDTGFTGTVTLAAYSDAQCKNLVGSVSGGPTNAVAGVATFTVAAYTAPTNGASSVYLLATSAGAESSACMGPVAITSSGAHQLGFSTQPPSTATAGANYTPSVSVAVQDACSFTVTSSSAMIGLGGYANSTCGTAVSTGTFTSATLVTTGNTNSTTSVTSVASTTGILVGSTVTGAGIPASTAVSAISGSTITLNKAATATASGVTLTFGGVQIAASSGIATFAGVSYTVANNLFLKATSSGLTAGCSTATAIGGASPAKIALNTSSTPTINVCSPAWQAELEDTFGNLTSTNGATTVNLSSSLVATGVLANASTSVTGLSSTQGITTGQAVTGTGIPALTTVAGISGTTLTLSAAATASNTQGTVTIAGAGTALIYSDSGCTTPVTSVSIPANNQTASFYIKNANVDATLITATAASPSSTATASTFFGNFRTVADLQEAPGESCSPYIMSGDLSQNVFISGYSVFASPVNHGIIFKSADGGATWSKLFTYQYATGQNTVINTKVVNPTGNILLVGTLSVDSGGLKHAVILRSTDAGQNWTPVDDYVYPGTGGQAASVDIVVDPTSSSTLYEMAAGLPPSSGPVHLIIRKSTDTGQHFSPIVDDFYATLGSGGTANGTSLGNSPGGFSIDSSGNVWTGSYGITSTSQNWLTGELTVGGSWNPVADEVLATGNKPSANLDTLVDSSGNIWGAGSLGIGSTSAPNSIREMVSGSGTWTTVFEQIYPSGGKENFTTVAQSSTGIYVGGHVGINTINVADAVESTDGGSTWKYVDGYYYALNQPAATYGSLANPKDPTKMLFLTNGQDANGILHCVVRSN